MGNLGFHVFCTSNGKWDFHYEHMHLYIYNRIIDVRDQRCATLWVHFQTSAVGSIVLIKVLSKSKKWIPKWSYFDRESSLTSVIGRCRTCYPVVTNTVNRIDETGFSTSGWAIQEDSKMLDGVVVTFKIERLQRCHLIFFITVYKKDERQ